MNSSRRSFLSWLAAIPILGPLLVDTRERDRELAIQADRERTGPGPVERMKEEQAARRLREDPDIFKKMDQLIDNIEWDPVTENTPREGWSNFWNDTAHYPVPPEEEDSGLARARAARKVQEKLFAARKAELKQTRDSPETNRRIPSLPSKSPLYEFEEFVQETGPAHLPRLDTPVPPAYYEVSGTHRWYAGPAKEYLPRVTPYSAKTPIRPNPDWPPGVTQ